MTTHRTITLTLTGWWAAQQAQAAIARGELEPLEGGEDDG